MGAALALGGDLGRPQDGVRRLLLASTSPQRKAILEQLGIPFDVVVPSYREDDFLPATHPQTGSPPPGLTPSEAVCAHALGKARSVAALAEGRPVLGVDTAVVLDARIFGKPAGVAEARAMLSSLAGRCHEVVSGLALLAPGVQVVENEVTRVVFRPLGAAEIEAYVETGEWKGRAGAYAIQGRGASLVDRIDGDYLNVVGLPAALLVRVLARHYPGDYGFGE